MSPYSLDHDHVVADLADRFDAVLDALERESDWIPNRATPGKIILGTLGDIEAGVRQMIRARPLEVEDMVLPAAFSDLLGLETSARILADIDRGTLTDRRRIQRAVDSDRTG